MLVSSLLSCKSVKISNFILVKILFLTRKMKIHFNKRENKKNKKNKKITKKIFSLEKNFRWSGVLTMYGVRIFGFSF